MISMAKWCSLGALGAALVGCGASEVAAVEPARETRETPLAETRDPWLWPFAATSPWNMPIGSGAQYAPANIQNGSYSTVDVDLLYRVPAGAPVRNVYTPGAWGPGRCTGTTPQGTLTIPDNLIVPDATSTHTPNNASAFLLADGRTLVQLNPLARCTYGGNVYGWRTPNVDIYGEGLPGGHGGSGLSSIGGTIRLGELTGTAPIRHALKANLWAKKYLYYSASAPTPGYRWPALRADSYAASGYGGTNPQLVMGSLLAIPPSVTEASLGLRTPAGRKLFRALQDYGAYVVDDTAWDVHALSVQEGVTQEFKAFYGYDFFASSGDFFNDFNALFRALHVVTNSDPNSVGGGGTPRAPLAPPFGTSQPPAGYLEDFNDGQAQGWSVASGTWAVTAGEYRISSVNAYDKSLYTGATFATGFQYTARVYSPYGAVGNTLGLLYNHVNASNFYEVKLTPTGLVSINRVVNGARAQVASSTYTGAGQNKWVKVEVTRAGTATTVRINDVTVFSNLSQPELGAGQVGLFSEWNPATFDDVTVTQ
jgi:hypothetical protein